MKKSQTYGYARCSTKEQNEDRQIISMLDFGVVQSNIIVEKISGKDFNRPAYRSLLARLQAGDVLVVKSIDRLGRDYEEIILQWRYITKEIKADIVVIDMPLLDTRQKPQNLTGAFVSDMVLQILSYVAETERSALRQRQAEGIAAAKQRGVKFGRPLKSLPSNFDEIVQKWHQKNMSLDDVLKQTGLTKSTFYRKVSKV